VLPHRRAGSPRALGPTPAWRASDCQERRSRRPNSGAGPPTPLRTGRRPV